MKTCFIFIFLPFLMGYTAQAQRFGFIDTERILSQMPAYKDAGQQLDQLTQQWKTEMDQMQRELVVLRQKLEAEKVIYTEEMLQARQEEITVKENNLQRFQEKHFGYEGELFKKRRELIGPLQAQIFEASRITCKKRKLNALFDTASDLHVIYFDENLDFTAEVMEELGIKAEKKG
ncbi:MAG: OmpH family outer membrane protein [Bernardetiaceae bacterium]